MIDAKECCHKCKYRLYAVLENPDGVICEYFWRDEECELYKASKEMMKPIQETLDMVETIKRINEECGI